MNLLFLFVLFSSEDDRLKEASVSHEFIVKQSSVPFYTQQKPPEIVIKAQEKKGENSTQVAGETTNGKNNLLDKNNSAKFAADANVKMAKGDNHSESGSNNCRKKKMKKKKIEGNDT